MNIEIKKAIEAKRVKYKEQGFADKDFEKTVGGVKIHMWLPESVFTQQTLLLMASRTYQTESSSIDEEAILNERYIKAIAKHTKINGEMLNPESVGLADCQAYALMYWLELLSPLSVWGESRAKKMITS